MNKFVNTLLSDDFLWDKISRAIPGQRKHGGNAFINFNCPMCTSRGEARPDTRMRCGVKNNYPGVGVHCFNCNFRALWSPGENLSKSMREFMEAIGVPHREIQKINIYARQTRSLLEDQDIVRLDQKPPRFDCMALPEGSRSIEEWAEDGCQDPNFLKTADYMFSRGSDVIGDTRFYWTPLEDHRLNQRLIIPYLQKGEIVGYTARSVEDGKPLKYYTQSRPDYLFNIDALTNRKRRVVVLVEGVFDAIAVDGVGLCGARLNAQQIAWINATGKTVILVPDRDKAGARLIDLAVENQWNVAFPTFREGKGNFVRWWEPDVKDCAEAVRRYGRLWVLMSILKTAVSDKNEIKMKRVMYF
jgi:hypothetical protein